VNATRIIPCIILLSVFMAISGDTDGAAPPVTSTPTVNAPTVTFDGVNYQVVVTGTVGLAAGATWTGFQTSLTGPGIPPAQPTNQVINIFNVPAPGTTQPFKFTYTVPGTAKGAWTFTGYVQGWTGAAPPGIPFSNPIPTGPVFFNVPTP